MEGESYSERLEGRREATGYIISNMLDEGLSIDLIKKVTGLCEQEIDELLREVKHERRLRLIHELTGMSFEEIEEIDYKKYRADLIELASSMKKNKSEKYSQEEI